MENIYECINWRMENKFSRLLCAWRGVVRRTEVFSFSKKRCRRELEHRHQMHATQMAKTIRQRVLKCSIYTSPNCFLRIDSIACVRVCDEWYIVELMLLSLCIVFALRIHFLFHRFAILLRFHSFSCSIYLFQRCLSQCKPTIHRFHRPKRRRAFLRT